MDLPLLVPVFDDEEVIEDALLQLLLDSHFRSSLEFEPTFRRDLGSLCNGKLLKRPSRVAGGLKSVILGLLGILSRYLFSWHCGERKLIFKILVFVIIIIISEFILPF